jgi:hypothetical protein
MEEKELNIDQASAQPMPEDPNLAQGSAPDQEDISDIIGMLNEMAGISGGEEKISDVPQNMRGVIRFMIQKMIVMRDLFKDPLYKIILDDMADQAEDGKTPSLLVAFVRNVPRDEYEELADSEDYESAQGRVSSQLSDMDAAKQSEDELLDKFNESQEAGKRFAKSMGYDDQETVKLFGFAFEWFKILGDGVISENEWAKVDKMRNYDADVDALKRRMPQAPRKEVLPDKSSMASASIPTRGITVPSATNSIERMGVGMANPTEDITQVGKRKFIKS